MSQVKVADLALGEIDRIKPLLGQSRFKPLRFFASDQQDVVSFWLNTIIELMRDRQARVFVAQKEGQVEGMVVYADNPWETRILGEKAGVISHLITNADSAQEQVLEQLLDQTTNWVASQGVGLLLCKPYTDDTLAIHALERHGFLLMDTVVDCCYDFRQFPLQDIPRPTPRGECNLRLAGKDDIAELMSVAQAAFHKHFGRYHADARISRETATRVYAEWIKSSVEGYADWICVAEIEGRIAGYSVWKKPSPLEQNLKVRVGHYSIAGIHPDFSGKGLFTALTYEGMKLLEGVAGIIEGPTHINNYGVQLGYAKLRWRVCCDARHSFHKWLTGE